MSNTTLNSKLTARLASTSTGHAAVIDGILDVRSISDSPNRAALNALYLVGYQVRSNCTDPDCDCFIKALARIAPAVKILPVQVEVAQ